MCAIGDVAQLVGGSWKGRVTRIYGRALASRSRRDGLNRPRKETGMIDHRDEHFTPAEARAKVGQRIRTRVPFSGVPKGTTGTVLEPDDELVTLPIQWDLPGRTRPLVDWFSRWEYERYLEEAQR